MIILRKVDMLCPCCMEAHKVRVISILGTTFSKTYPSIIVPSTSIATEQMKPMRTRNKSLLTISP